MGIPDVKERAHLDDGMEGGWAEGAPEDSCSGRLGEEEPPSECLGRRASGKGSRRGEGQEVAMAGGQ